MFNKSYYLIYPLIIVLLSACVSLEHVNSFAETSVAGLQEGNNIGFDFTTYCSDYTQKALRPLLDTNLNTVAIDSCEDAGFKNADSILELYNNVLTAYLSGLQKLSDKKLLAFYLDDLVANLQGLQGQVFKDVSFSGTQVAAAQSLASRLLQEPLNIYRKKKLKQLIVQNDSAFTHIMDAYIFSLNALSGELNQAKANYSSFVSTDMYLKAVSTVEKMIIVQDYRRRIATLNEKQEALQKYITALGAIRDGYNALAAGDLKDDNLKKSIRQYTVKILETIQDVQSLK